MPQQCPYVENDYLYQSDANITFGEVIQYNDEQFREWISLLRKAVIFAWDELGIPPNGGQDEDIVVSQFNEMLRYDVGQFEREDELTFTDDCIVNTTPIGTACNQFFPTMLKTKDIHSSDLQGISIYDYFKNDALEENFVNKTQKRFQNDDVFLYSDRVQKQTETHVISADTGKEWIKQFNESVYAQREYDFWLEKKTDNKRYKGRLFLNISLDDIHLLRSQGLLEQRHLCRADIDSAKKSDRFRIRFFKRDLRLFPKANQVFRLGLGLFPPTNFPPLTAKYLYLKFTEEFKGQNRIVIYDPSAGWGGRILGAMSARERKIHYVGTDPNTDHWMPDYDQTKYEYLAEYFNGNVRGGRPNTFELFTEGSEVIHKAPKFKKYKGKVDLVFTSPPYFAAEGYSDDDTQSYKKFPVYEEWRDGFLRRTLQTAVEYLKPNRYLLWNIADVGMDGGFLSMERDSKEILLSLGMKYCGFLKMVLKSTPGGNKQNWHGVATTKNFCRINGVQKKYEPIFIFKKTG
ncbi:site-specific DNA-methyltransferase [Rhodospirillales bacterium]|nr:site-specific DNA-methyltransferase [Rhodospirillales bacterium]